MASRGCPRLAALLAAALVAAAPGGARASEVAELAGVSFARELRVGDTSLALHSLGLLRWLFFEAYVAALYLGDDAPPQRALADVPKRLEIHYFRAIDGARIGEAALAILERNFGPERLLPLRPRIDAIAGLYRDVAPGDRYALTYLPGRGTELSFNGEPRGTIPGADFAEAYFAIWLGAQPIDASLRDQLLRKGP